MAKGFIGNAGYKAYLGGVKLKAGYIGAQRVYSAEYIPAFTYTGRYQVLDDGNENWRIKFLTSGTLIFNDLNSAENGIDLFLVGGGASGSRGDQEEGDDDGAGGGGGGGGFTLTVKNKIILPNTAYPIAIGAGGIWNSSMGDNAGNGGASSAFGHSAAGGQVGWYSTGVSAKDYTRHNGGYGGSGGGAGGNQSNKGVGAGGTDGSNGTNGSYWGGGKGQGATTREFGEPTGTLYAGGGGGGASYGWDSGGVGGPGGGRGASGWCVGGSGATSGSPNTGGGGGGGGNQPSNVNSVGAGGSGIVIIRNKR